MIPNKYLKMMLVYVNSKNMQLISGGHHLVFNVFSMIVSNHHYR
jgi:hypothetical protein